MFTWIILISIGWGDEGLDLYMEFHTLLHFIPQIIIISALSIMSYIFIKENKGNIRAKFRHFFKQGWIPFHVSYCTLLVTVTLIGRYKTNPYTNMIGTFGVFNNGRINSEILVNVLLYIPYTYSFIKVHYPKRVAVSCLCLSLITTCTIETLQLLFWLGQFSLADIIHNVLGGMLGYVLWLLIHTGKNANWMTPIRAVTTIRKKLRDKKDSMSGGPKGQ